jgi:hypothetical protein
MVVLAGCGHIELEATVIKVLGSMVKDVYCENCDEWRPIERESTALERAGMTITQTELPINPPF